MKMVYFTWIADQAFSTDRAGNHLFHLHGPFSRPYLLPSAETKDKLHRKLTWFYRIYLPLLLLVLMIWSDVFSAKVAWFVVLLAVAIAVQQVIFWLMLHNDLKAVPRVRVRVPLREYFLGMANRNSKSMLVLGFIGCLLFVFSSVLMLALGVGPILINLAVIVFFGCCSGAWGYALKLKR